MSTEPIPAGTTIRTAYASECAICGAWSAAYPTVGAAVHAEDMARTPDGLTVCHECAND